MKIKLSDCPEVLQKAVEEKISKLQEWYGGCEIISVTVLETTPYKDKSIVSKTYRVFIMAANYFDIVKYSECDSNHFNIGVTSDCVNIGELEEIIRCASGWVGMKNRN